MVQQSVLADELDWVYVMTDFTERNLSFWEAHASLRPFVDAGVLDWTLFDCTSSDALELRVSGTRLATGAGTHMVAIANYLFDTIPQELYILPALHAATSKAPAEWSQPGSWQSPPYVDPLHWPPG